MQKKGKRLLSINRKFMPRSTYAVLIGTPVSASFAIVTNSLGKMKVYGLPPRQDHYGSSGPGK